MGDMIPTASRLAQHNAQRLTLPRTQLVTRKRLKTRTSIDSEQSRKRKQRSVARSITSVLDQKPDLCKTAPPRMLEVDSVDDSDDDIIRPSSEPRRTNHLSIESK